MYQEFLVDLDYDLTRDEFIMEFKEDIYARYLEIEDEAKFVRDF